MINLVPDLELVIIVLQGYTPLCLEGGISSPRPMPCDTVSCCCACRGDHNLCLLLSSQRSSLKLAPAWRRSPSWHSPSSMLMGIIMPSSLNGASTWKEPTSSSDCNGCALDRVAKHKQHRNWAKNSVPPPPPKILPAAFFV